MTEPDPFEIAYFTARGQARLTSTGHLLRVEAALRQRRDHLDAGEAARWAAIRSVLAEREIELPPVPGACD